MFGIGLGLAILIILVLGGAIRNTLVILAMLLALYIIAFPMIPVILFLVACDRIYPYIIPAPIRNLYQVTGQPEPASPVPNNQEMRLPAPRQRRDAQHRPMCAREQVPTVGSSSDSSESSS
ncbi:hypothetical protein GGS26DRAFT_284774 [Hypomontagnella submonticulosa]|nr:hypothetical protein GGS26DRAFT_284774 [Hypomontagnella submonticulosa]